MIERKAKRKLKHGEVTTYRLRLWNRLVAFCLVAINGLWVLPVFIVGIIDPSALSLDEPFRSIFVLTLFPIFYGFWRVCYQILFQRLVVSEKGLALFYPGWKGFVAWDDFSHFGWSSPTTQAPWGIWLSQPVPRDMVWHYRLFLLRRRKFIALDTWSQIPRIHFLSQKVDIDRFEQTPLGQDLLYYAPHLFEEDKVKR